MANKKAKGSSIPRREVLRQHRRARVSVSKVVSYSFSGIGDKLYLLGTEIERNRKSFWRSLKKGVRAMFAGLFGVLKKFFGAIGRGVASVWRDLSTPFKKMRRSVKSLFTVIKSTKGRGFGYTMNRVRLFFKYGWKWNKHLVGRMLNYALPAVALVLCVTMLSTMLNLNYALRVSYNGETVGYIENESVYNSARKIIQNRMMEGNEQDILTDNTELTIAVAQGNQVVSQDIMAESLLYVSGSEIANATGIYIGGTFYGATTAPALLEEKLEELKAPYYAVAEELGDNTVVKFARDVVLETGVYPAESVMPIEELIAEITDPKIENVYYSSSIGRDISEVAFMNGLTVETLREMNPVVDEISYIEGGTSLLVSQDEPLLRVKTVRNVAYTQPVAYDTTLIYDSSHNVNYYFFLQEGQSGERTITKEVEYDADGNVVLEHVVSDILTTPPVNQQIIVGTQGGVNSIGSARLSWPTGGGFSITRGWNSDPLYGSLHYGVDIAAAYATPIYAAESGTVVTAVYTSVGYGVYIILQHEGGLSTVYAHCSSLLVTQGQYVQRGQVIALMGSTGNSTGNHLHFEVRLDGTRVPPEEWIGLK